MEVHFDGPLQRWDGDVEVRSAVRGQHETHLAPQPTHAPGAQGLEHAQLRVDSAGASGARCPSTARNRLAHGRPGVASRSAVRCSVPTVQSRRLRACSIIDASDHESMYRVRSTTVLGGLVNRMPSGRRTTSSSNTSAVRYARTHCSLARVADRRGDDVDQAIARTTPELPQTAGSRPGDDQVGPAAHRARRSGRARQRRCRRTRRPRRRLARAARRTPWHLTFVEGALGSELGSLEMVA